MNIRDSLIELNMNTGYELQKFSDMPVLDYLKKGLENKKLNCPNLLYLALFKKNLRKFLITQNHYKSDDINNYIELLSKAPFIQRVDHGELLIDKSTFLNNFFYQIAARENDIPFLLTKQCTRVKCITNRRLFLGASYIDYKDNIYKIFDKPKGVLNDVSIETLQNIHIVFNPLKQNNNINIHPLIEPFVGCYFPNARDAVLKINYEIWNNLNIPNKRPLILINDTFCAELLKLHLLNSHSVVNNILTDKNLLSTFLSTYSEYINKNPTSLLNKTTDLFWLNDEKVLKPLRYFPSQNRFELKENNTIKKTIPVDQNVLLTALDKKEIYPDIVLSYLLNNILTGLTAYGGTAQHEYLPAIKNILLNFNDKVGILSEKEKKIIQENKPSSLNLSSLITIPDYLSKELDKMDKNYDFNVLEDIIKQKPIKDFLGDMTKMSYMVNIPLNKNKYLRSNTFNIINKLNGVQNG